jgi:N-acetylglucosamine kinase-like BadF-type ATPase
MLHIGIDAGGTRTRVVSLDETGLAEPGSTPINESILGPGNFRLLGETGVRELVQEILEIFLIDDPQAASVVAGFAGAGTPESQASIRDAFVEAGFGKVTITSDAGLLLMSLENSGIVLVAGTGSICMGRKPCADNPMGFDEYRAGGYGYRLMSEPGGYRVGIQAIDAALRVTDGRSEQATALEDVVRDYFRMSDLRQIVPELYPDEADTESIQAKVAGLSPLVLAAAVEGDRVAGDIVSDTVDDMADHVRAVCRQLNLRDSVVGLHGGLFGATGGQTLLMDPLQSHPQLSHLSLRYRTLGLPGDDTDPLIEAMRFDTEQSRHALIAVVSARDEPKAAAAGGIERKAVRTVADLVCRAPCSSNPPSVPPST